MADSTSAAAKDFVRAMVERDLAAGKYEEVATRFPPEPNGHLHIGHAKAICLGFGLAEEFGGTCNLRFDDTNPETEDMEYVEAIQRDVRSLGFEWTSLCFASDYFERFYEYAVELVRAGKAYVDDHSEEEIRRHRGTVTEPGRPSPGRDRSVEENEDLFARMRAGEFPDGSRVLRAKIDLAHPNMKMRDPVLYRVLHRSHYRTGDAWCIYPLYDHAHCLSDSIEGITHSLCTLEFENNRAIYDWILDNVEVPRPRPEQTEFARLNLTYTVLSKRKLAQLVAGGHVEGWGDPRMPTLWGLRRRGYTREAIRAFCDAVGVAKANSVVDVAMLEHAVRDDLNYRAPRVLCVFDPLKVTITNFPEGEEDWLDGDYWPRDIPKEGTRPLPFSRELWIERSDFMEDPPGKFYRLAPGREVRLRYGYFIRCEEVVKDARGEVVELRCTYDPETRGGQSPDGRKVKGTIHWVSAAHALPVEVRLYDRLFRDEQPGAGGGDFLESLNPESLSVADAWIEPSLAGAEPGSHFQFERHGYFYLDPESQTGDRPVFNRTVALRDRWSRHSR
jgi:glutaminyl-tRNA synthetase